MNEDRDADDWLAELAKGGEALRRQVEPIVQAAEQFVRDARQAKVGGGPALPFAQRVALAVDAGLREFLPARMDADVRPVTIEASVAFPAVIVASGGLVLSPMSIAGQGTVEDRPSGLAALSDGQIVVLVLVWLFAVVLPWLAAKLPPEQHEMLSDSLTTFAIALSVAWRIRDKSK